MNAIITDGEMANITLQGVETTHRCVVRLFNQPNMVGAENLEPDLDVVLNTPRGEAERGKSIGDGVKSDDERPVKAMQAKQWGQQKKKPFSGGRKKGKKETRTCYYCKKKGHLRAQCYAYKANQKKVFGGDDGKSSGNNGSGNNKSPTPSGLMR
ncbi:hypothetical protein PF005_g30958 [Phytophthora fragariae]|uniref:CCHC-type domain-containing protein n=1 Tax=Phytophthora fragariae TaxID=53985 RepID=A0A6A3H1J9_9STRA|nr:hypothetical protein PF009_g27288 [Phytophthora fragariae]KAE8962915.1 hypothetical protein PF011_g29215 [Phytophthora fragariae]KAE9070883.1 hypothetical protein PF007_g26768 [Phytophthora fragariae]KAE9085206.1 hypothetical protein PF006_g26306 [Phytophthora fragariae]KAE9161252.1 hypothetical protein PF004_g30895 [Phytophthora fragariae]